MTETERGNQVGIAVNIEYSEKVRRIATGDHFVILNSLMELFEHRKRIARALMRNENNELHKQLEYINTIITRALSL